MMSRYQSGSNNKKKHATLDKTVLFFYALYFILNPFYLWSSGLPQIADFFMLTGIIIFSIHSKFNFKFCKNSKTILFIGLLFVSWVIIVNLTWAIRLPIVDNLLISTVFYIYNFIVLIYVIALKNKYGMSVYKVTLYAILISLILEFIVFLVKEQSSVRAIGSFNNPNQLGYYALLMLIFIMFLSRKINIKLKWLVIGIITSTILSFASLSKAAIIAHIGLIIVFIFSIHENKNLKKKLLIFFIFLFTVLGITYNTTAIIQNNQLINKVEQRLASIGIDSDDNLEGRGYYRILEYPEYWLFGAGEGAYSRFRNHSIEFHSTLGNIQVSYGLIGSFLFATYIFLILKKNRFENWYIIFFVMLYGLTHNGIRNTLFWIILALMIEDKNHTREKLDVCE